MSGAQAIRTGRNRYFPVSSSTSCFNVTKGVHAVAHRGDVIDVLDRVVLEAGGHPLFLFPDPCGLGVPFDRLVTCCPSPAATPGPPIEVLLNFSLDAVRRIGGHVTSPSSNPATLARLDQAVGGTWWRASFPGGVTGEAVEDVVNGFRQRLATAAGMLNASVPVRQAPWHKPLYHLVIGTRRAHGL